MIPVDTIVAPATPFGIGGIAVIRLSGPCSEEIVTALSVTAEGQPPLFIPRYATLVLLRDDQGVRFEEALVTFFNAPNSYTGEDVVEVSCHGSPVIVQKIVDRCCALGARVADPGEFTQRAFLNGKIDLIQAESVAALIHSQSTESSFLNFRLLSGALSQKINTIKQEIIRALSLVEFELDISEEELLPNLKSELLSIINPLKLKVVELLSSYKQGRLLTDGALVVIVGEPNVGKSTLLNALAESDRAITSQIPGTTRDPIDVSLFINGVPIKLVDTAGLHDALGEIEREGVRRTRSYSDEADLLLVMTTIGTPQDAASIEINNKHVINIINKIDLHSNTEREQFKADYPDVFLISALTGDGLDQLKAAIKDALGISSALSQNVAVTTARQQAALQQCKKGLATACNQLHSNVCAYELISIDLREALNAIDVILGKTTPEDILNNIFRSFCVGK